ncbi:hypothetical protein CASFOL_025920 [Castilleja foliolosa]|uniref:Uncharacterized protein n=1 Tax=Castilleja foliolosa TaxID=1961234 RepID=A0ABD3CVS7_9LAMI
MDRFSRSKSSRGNQVQPNSMNNLRSFSTSTYNLEINNGNFKEVKEDNICRNSSSKSWNFNLDPELQRKKRVASYKAYSMEGKMKGSMKKSFKWVKETCYQVAHGFW